MHFSLYRAADPVAALQAARAIVDKYASGEDPLRPLDLDNAKGSLASGLIEQEQTRSAALRGAWRRSLLGLLTHTSSTSVFLNLFSAGNVLFIF